MASVILHLCHREPYPILDYRALWSVGAGEPGAGYDAAFWERYVGVCRGLAGEAGCSLRELDRALRGYSKMNAGTPK